LSVSSFIESNIVVVVVVESNSQRLNKIVQSKQRNTNTKTINTLEKNYEV